MDSSLFSFNNYDVLIILLHVKCKESILVIKLQMAYTGESIKSRGKNYSQGFWQGTGKILIVWNVERKRLVWYEQLTFPYIVLLQYKNIFKILARLFVLFMHRKKGQQHNLSFDKRPTQSINVKYDEKLTSAQDRVNYSRNTSFSCYKTLKESNGRLNERVAINRILAFAQRVLGSPRGKRVSTKRRPKTKDRRLKTEDRRLKTEKRRP